MNPDSLDATRYALESMVIDLNRRIVRRMRVCTLSNHDTVPVIATALGLDAGFVATTLFRKHLEDPIQAFAKLGEALRDAWHREINLTVRTSTDESKLH